MVPQALVAATPVKLELDKDRAYLAVIPTASVTVTFSNGVSFVLGEGQVWAPIPAPINELTIEGAGTVITG